MSIPSITRGWREIPQLQLAMLLALATCGCAQTSGETLRSPSEERSAGADSAWLDHAPENWNRRMSELPRPPSPAHPKRMAAYCLQFIRQPQSPSEQALVRAGWLLYGEVQSSGNTRVVTAMSNVDGMCRPLGYQAFVYWEGRYAGTLSPALMNSRADGALTRFQLESPTRIVAEFARYRTEDPLCCPSAISRVTYEVRRDDAPLVTPREIEQPEKPDAKP